MSEDDRENGVELGEFGELRVLGWGKGGSNSIGGFKGGSSACWRQPLNEEAL